MTHVMVHRGSNGRHLGGKGASHLGASHKQGTSEAAEKVQAESGNQGKLLATVALIAGLLLLLGTGFFFKDKVCPDQLQAEADSTGILGSLNDLPYGVEHIVDRPCCTSQMSVQNSGEYSIESGDWDTLLERTLAQDGLHISSAVCASQRRVVPNEHLMAHGGMRML